VILAWGSEGTVRAVDTPGPVRALHLVKGLGPGGAERLLVSMASVADPSAVQHQVAYLLGHKDHLVPELEGLGVATHLLAGARGLGDLRWPGRLRRLAREVDVVHLHSPAVAAIARPALRTMRRPGPVVVSTEHNLWGSHGVVTRTANALTLPLDRVRWAVSAEVVASEWRPWRAKAEVLVHGVPLAALQARRSARASARAEQGWAEDDVVVSIVANLRANKDYPTLFAAAALAVAEEPRLRFVSVGQGPLEDALRAELASRALGERFVMLGYHEDPAAVVVGADVFTLSSRHEGLPISLLEAMALGIAPVVTRVGGNAEVVTDERDGLLVAPGDPAALAAAYVRLARDPADRARLAAAAAARAEAFDITRAARTVEARYRSLVPRRS
jgi:glycosyltransferase involved in cell wall biosynthesis